ncbi:MAG: hypothetical protein WA294_12895 [Acidobacteriaceae bacterium]
MRVLVLVTAVALSTPAVWAQSFATLSAPPAATAPAESSSLTGSALFADPAPVASPGVIATPAASEHSGAFSGFALGVKVGLLGVGVEAATPLARHLNLSAGTNFFSYTDTLTNDGIPYNANLRFRSAEAAVDWFPFAGGFHISPGALLYNGNQITANANVSAGKSFTLNNEQYTSSASDPVTGNGGITFNKAAPKITVGFGNMIPRSGRHFSVPVELGFAYVGDPKVNLTLAGTACYNDQGQNYCDNVATDSMIQSNLAAQRQKIANDVSPARFYPIFSVGPAFSF